jgi:hypothetical protein
VLLFVFVDGIGLGSADPAHNPFARYSLPGFEHLTGGQKMVNGWTPLIADGQVAVPLDATLGVAGLPQSGTGQSTLLTGQNCAKLAGRHYGPFPHSSSLGTIETANVFVRLNGCDPARAGAFVNAYPDRFFEYVHRTDRWTVTTLCCLKAGVPLRTIHDMEDGQAIAADITGARLQRIGIETREISEEEAAARFVTIGESNHVTLFEYFLTDKAGHSRDMDRAGAVLKSLNAFLEGILQHIDRSRHTLIVTSDHGNLEDLSTKSHTRNPVPFFAVGADAGAFRGLQSIADVTPAIERLMHSRDQKTKEGRPA